MYWCSVGIHCVAIPVYVLLRRLARSSAALSFASAFDRPVTSLLAAVGYLETNQLPWCVRGHVARGVCTGLLSGFRLRLEYAYAFWNFRWRRMGLVPRASVGIAMRFGLFVSTS